MRACAARKSVLTVEAGVNLELVELDAAASGVGKASLPSTAARKVKSVVKCIMCRMKPRRNEWTVKLDLVKNGCRTISCETITKPHTEPSNKVAADRRDIYAEIPVQLLIGEQV